MLLYSRTPGDVDKVAIKLNTMLETLTKIFEIPLFQEWFTLLFCILIFAAVYKWLLKREDEPEEKVFIFDEELNKRYKHEFEKGWCDMTKTIYSRIAYEFDKQRSVSPRMAEFYNDLLKDKVSKLKRPVRRMYKERKAIGESVTIQQGETLTLR